MSVQSPAVYSVLMPLYYREKPENLRESLQSILNQTLKPREIVLVRDHPTPPELMELVEASARGTGIPIVIVDCFDLQKEGKKLGAILARGVERCSSPLIARMDSDDYSRPERCELQVQEFQKDPCLDVLGTGAAEFQEHREEPLGCRSMPQTAQEVRRYMACRNPIIHPSVMFRKTSILQAGNYDSHLAGCEDYELWYRVVKSGGMIRNLPQTLLCYRTSGDTLRRRRSEESFRSGLRLKRRMADDSFISRPRYLAAVFLLVLRQYMPLWMVSLAYRWRLRKRAVPIGSHNTTETGKQVTRCF